MVIGKRRKAFILVAGIFVAALCVISAAGSAHSATISKAVWTPAQFLLQVAGSGWGSGASVTITDAGTGGHARYGHRQLIGNMEPFG